MRRIAGLLAVSAAVAAGCGWPAAWPTGTSRACTTGQLRAAVGPEVSEATGQHTVSLALTNAAGAACTLRGYPTVALLARDGAALPFVIRDAGDQMVTDRPPRALRLQPGHSGYVVINKYRCDLGDLRVAAVVTLGLPSSGATISVPLGSYADIAVCGRGDPGSVVHVSPFEPTLARALRHG